MFFTARRHSDRSAVGLTGSYETLQIDQAEVRTKCANSILVRVARTLQVSGFAFLVSLFDLSKRAIRCSLLADLAFSRLINPVLL